MDRGARARRIRCGPHPRRTRRCRRVGWRADRRIGRRHRGHLDGGARPVDPAGTGTGCRRLAVGARHPRSLHRRRCAGGLQPRYGAGRLVRQHLRPARARRADRRPCRQPHRADAGLRCPRRAAGHRRVDGLTAHRAAVARGGAQQRHRIAGAHAGGPLGRRRLHLAAALPRHGIVLPAQRRARRRRTVAGAHRGILRIAVPMAALAVRESRVHDGRTELRLHRARQVCAPGFRCRPRRLAVRPQRRRTDRL